MNYNLLNMTGTKVLGNALQRLPVAIGKYGTAHIIYSSGYKLGPLMKRYKWSNKWSMVTLRFLAPVTAVGPETLL